MLRKFVCAALTLMFCAVCALADSYTGKVKSVDANAGTLTVTVNDKDMEFKVPAGAKVIVGKKDAPDGLRAKQFKKAAGADVTVVTEKKDGTETVTEVRLQKKKKNK
jgi:Cu/Ag efflux protein CusF